MPTKQLPFFLNSAKGSNLTPLGNAFDVKLDPPVKQAVDKAADFAKSKVSNSLGREAINEAERAAKAMIGDGRRMHGMGHSGGVRLSGRGHCQGSGMRAVGYSGSGMRIPHANE